SATLNGNPLKRSFIYHSEVMDGGKLVFTMTDKASSWATKDDEIPKTEITENLIVLPPFISKGEVAFKNKTEISLEVAVGSPEIFYSINNSVFKKYQKPFNLSEETVLNTYSQKEGKKSPIITTHFYKIDPNLSIKLETEYANQYNGGGKNALIDGIHGAGDF